LGEGRWSQGGKGEGEAANEAFHVMGAPGRKAALSEVSKGARPSATGI
jgi:hypothetical protein